MSTSTPASATTTADRDDAGIPPFKPRFSIAELVSILGISRASIYSRVAEGKLALSKDGHRAFVTRGELLRYLREIH